MWRKRSCFDVVVLQYDECARCKPLLSFSFHREPSFVRKNNHHTLQSEGIERRVQKRGMLWVSYVRFTYHIAGINETKNALQVLYMGKSSIPHRLKKRKTQACGPTGGITVKIPSVAEHDHVKTERVRIVQKTLMPQECLPTLKNPRQSF